MAKLLAKAGCRGDTESPFRVSVAFVSIPIEMRFPRSSSEAVDENHLNQENFSLCPLIHAGVPLQNTNYCRF